MRKWLPWIAVTVAGLALALLLFGIGMMDTAVRPDKALGGVGRKKAAISRSEADDPQGQGADAAAPGTEGRTAGGPPPTRAPNKAELAQTARRARPFNTHYEFVASYWTKTEQLLLAGHPDIAAEAGQMERYLRDQSNANEISVEEALRHELDLIAKIRAFESDPELRYVVDYIYDSAQITLQNGDPSTVLKPSQRKAAQGNKAPGGR